MQRVILIAAVQLAACAQHFDTETVEATLRGRTEARPCRADTFYVDVPLRFDPIWSNASFLTGFDQAIELDANAPGFPWFCGTGAMTCPSTAVQAAVSSVLKSRNEPFRSDGHLRFFRVRFSDSSGAPLSVRPDAQCNVIAAIRSRFVLHSGARPDMLHVGRECEASTSAAQDAPTEEMLTWHLARVGLPATAALVTEPPLSAQTVDLALIDSGVIAEVGTDPGGIGLASSIDLIPATAGFHAHGTGMAVLSRQVAPEASLHSLRALGPGGEGTGEAIAAAIDHALYVASSSRPLVINMSLGWPSELGRSSRITSPTCQSHEDPFGEPIRYLLDVARRLDESGSRRIFVAASAGNRPLPAPAPLFPPVAGFPQTPCSSSASAGPDWFFPAEWDRIDSCRATVPGFTRVAFGVSVVDDRELAASNAIPDAEAPLVVPGQHVYASHENAPIPLNGSQCGSHTPFPGPVTLPRAFTGSSVGAALVSAAAARTQATRLSRGKPPFGAMALARFLYLTGQDLCRQTPAGTPVRRLDVARLDHALSKCEDLVACTESISAADTIPPALADACRHELSDCGLEHLDGSGALIPNCAPTQRGVLWNASYLPNACTTDRNPVLFEDAALCTGVCPFADGSTKELLGSLGPQPGEPTCPDCQLYVYATSDMFDLIAELNDNFPAGTELATPYLILHGPVGTSMVKVYLDLTTISAPTSWVPGAHLTVSGSLDGVPQYDWSQTQAFLSIQVEQPGKVPVKDVSPLRVKH